MSRRTNGQRQPRPVKPNTTVTSNVISNGLSYAETGASINGNLLTVNYQSTNAADSAQNSGVAASLPLRLHQRTAASNLRRKARPNIRLLQHSHKPMRHNLEFRILKNPINSAASSIHSGSDGNDANPPAPKPGGRRQFTDGDLRW